MMDRADLLIQVHTAPRNPLYAQSQDFRITHRGGLAVWEDQLHQKVGALGGGLAERETVSFAIEAFERLSGTQHWVGTTSVHSYALECTVSRS